MEDEIDSPERRQLLTLLIFLLLFAATLPAKAKPKPRRRWQPEPVEPERVRHADASWVYEPEPHLPWMNFIGQEHLFTIAPGAWIDILGSHVHQWWTCRIETIEHVRNDNWGTGDHEIWHVDVRVHHIDQYDWPSVPPNHKEEFEEYWSRPKPADWLRRQREWVKAHEAKIGDLCRGEVRLSLEQAADQRRRIAAGESGRADGTMGPHYLVPIPIPLLRV